MVADYSSYFRHRRISGDSYLQYSVPPYLAKQLPSNRDARILDFGSGFGQFVREVRLLGYTQVTGYDIEPAALAYCTENGIPVIDGRGLDLADHEMTYDLIYCSHVIEHLPKEIVIEMLGKLRRLLNPGGMLLVCVPNGQSNTAAYWAFEDFTHYTLYTAGSIYYVLSRAGFSSIDFLDVDCTEGLTPMRAAAKRALLAIYKRNYRFWNRVTNSATHAPSPDIFSFEIKAAARG